MEVTLEGYRFAHRVRSSDVCEVWEAEREADGLALLANVYAIEARPGLDARIEHEFGQLRRLEIEGVVRALACVRSGRQLYLMHEVHAHASLAAYTGGHPLALERFFVIATQLCSILADVHTQRVLHRAVKPSNVLVGERLVGGGGERVMLTNFGISVLLEHARERIHDGETLRESLAYVSPEQTGRTGREVDYRSDLYSLGVTFYELLTGELPFEASTSLGLIHAHLARQPQPPQRLRPDLPPALSRLVLKLLAKAPERRYQSARGLLHDLLRMHEAFAAGSLRGRFVLGTADVPTSVRLPHQLYGREEERAALRGGLRRCLAQAPVFMVIKGEAGQGKSAMLSELTELSIAYGGRLARGRYEVGHDEPLHGLSQALDNLAEQLLTAKSEELERWRERLSERLGALCATLFEVAPRFEALLGASAPASGVLGADTARNRMRQACVRVLEELAEPEHPLILALDDAQWIDAATLDVLDSLAASQRLGLCVVMAARPHALAQPDGALCPLLDKLGRPAEAGGGRGVEIVTLSPLDEEQTVELLADTLSLDWREVTPLAEVVRRKTGGNPFFTGQFLLHLGERELLRRGPERWEWDLDALEGATLPESALDMLTRKLRRLDSRVRELVLAASVLGSHIEPGLLSGMLGVESVGPRLLHLVEEGLLAAGAQGRFRFVHGRVREAAYAMLTVAQRRQWHRAAGELMLLALAPAGREQQLFDLVEHLDRGHGLWPESALETMQDTGAPARPDEMQAAARTQLSELNLRAGERALANGAPAAAKIYLFIAEILVGGENAPLATQTQPRTLQLDIQLNLAQAETLTRAIDAASRRLAALFSEDLSAGERGRLATVRCGALVANGELEDALSIGLEILGSFSLSFDRRRNLDVTLERVRELIEGVDLDSLGALAPIESPELSTTLELLLVLSAASELAEPSLFAQLVLTHVELLLEHGAHVSLPVAFAQLAVLASTRLGCQPQALALGERCVELAGEGPRRHRVALLHVLLRLQSERPAALLDEVEVVFEAALSLGDTSLAMRSLLCEVRLGLWGGVHLRLVEARIGARLRWIEQWGVRSAGGEVEGVAGLCRRLVAGPEPDEVGTECGPLALHECLQLAIFGRWALLRERYASWRDAPRNVSAGGGWSVHAQALWGLACAERCRTASGGDATQLRAAFDASVASLRESSSSGGRGRALLAMLEGERATLDRQLETASRAYLRAQSIAAQEEHPLYEALASERHAEALAWLGHRALALGPILAAQQAYGRWGANAKSEALVRAWPQLERMRASSGDGGQSVGDAGGAVPGSSSIAGRAMDAASLLQASQTLAEDLRYTEVIERVMNIALENAGAQRCVLLLATKGRLSYAAEAKVGGGNEVLERPPVLADAADRVPASLLRYVLRTSEAIILRSASEDGRFAADPYFRALSGQARDGLSILCLPIVRRRRPVGLFYFENQLGTEVFSEARLALLELLAGHAGSALENARLYEHLRDNEIRWRSLVDQLPDYVILLRRDGSLEYVNALARPQQRSGASFDARRFISQQFSPEVSDTVSRVFSGGAQERLEVQVEISPGERRWYVARIAPISIEDAIARVLVVATDIEDRRQAEAARDGFEAQLRQQQRLDSIGILASGVAHEINNPVQGIMNYAELIANSSAADEMIREFADDIGHETRRVATIVRNLLAFARQEFIEGGEETSVAEIIEGTMSLVGAIIRRDQIKLETNIPADLPILHCRRQQIQQVVMNLVTNARDALNERYPSYSEDKRLAISGESFEREGNQWVSIRVRDHGGGILEADVAHVFDPFFTTRGRTTAGREQGTGLGLSVSHGIIADHAGQLRLDNEVGVGATFIIELPCAGHFRKRGR